ncbi:MAG: Ig-like domain-containing protein, partial [Acidobacteriota bacterium]
MITKRNTLVLLALAMLVASGAVQAAATGSFSVTPVTESRDSVGGYWTWSVVPAGPGWLPLPRLGIVLPGVSETAILSVSAGPGGVWQEVELVDGRGSLPFTPSNAAALWEVRLRTADALAAPPQIVPLDALVLASEGPVLSEAPALVTVTKWGDSAWTKVRAVDAVGAPIALETLAGADAGADAEGWHDLGFLNGADQGSLRVYLTPDVSYPVLVEAQTDTGETGVLVLSPENLLAGAADMIHYYGMAKPNWNCATRIYDGTYLWIVGIEDGTTYTVTDLDTLAVLATGTVNRGQKASLASPNPALVDNHRFRLATSRPVQAYMGFDCSGTLPGSMFFLADDGRSMYGSAFTVPVGGLDGRARYVVFAAGAGTAEIRTISGTLVASHTYTAAGYWDATASLTADTVYAVTSSGTTVAVQQSSQNTATEVPPLTMVVGGGTCAPSSLGNKFYVHVQDWNGVDPALVAIGYSDVDWRYRQLPSGSWNNTTVRINNTRRRTVTEGFYEVEVTTAGGTMGLLAGSYEGGTEIYDLGDDSVYYRGTGSNIRGHALRCGGSIFVAHDGTTVDETGATTTPALPATFDAGDVITLNGNTSSATPFRIYSQDENHPIVVEVFGGNCSTNLNDWSKVMLPAALARPVITYPDASGYLNDLTPTVTGTAVPGATVTLRVYDHNDGDTLVFTGTATVASDGTWSLEVTTTLTENHLYYFEAIQGLDGACPVDPLPPPGSSGSQGEIDTTPPAVPVITGPADGSSTSDATPTITGTAEANSVVTVCIGAECHTTLADGSGNWSLDWPTPLADGPYTVSATATDAAGNTSPAANNGFTVDTTPPAAPVVASISTDTGTSSSDGITSDNTLVFSGTAEAGSTVHVFLDGAEIGTTVADGSGTWSFDYTGTTLADGPYSVTATAEDGAGNTSPASAPFAVLVDTADPAAPAVTPLTTNDTTPAIHGTLGAALEAGDVFTVVVNGVTYTAGDGNLVV